MILAAHQPQYLPWLGYLDKIDRADVFVLLDRVQFKKNEWQNRNRVKHARGWHWLTVPVRHRFPQAIDEVEIADPRWRRKHRRSLEVTYGQAAHYRSEAERLEVIYGREWNDLLSLNVRTVRHLARRFGIETPILLGSEFENVSESHADERLISLCRLLEADTYLAGAGGRGYMDLSRWRRAGIRVLFQDFHHPVYPQLHGPFVPGLSAVDLLLHCGPEGFSRVRHGRKKEAA
jgi:hypothetical protein